VQLRALAGREAALSEISGAGERSAARPGQTFRQAVWAIILKSIALVLEFGEHLPKAEQAHELAETAERRVAARPARAVVRAAAVTLAVVSISALILLAPIDYEALGNYGYLGVFIITLITTGAFVLPVPYLAVIFKAGTFLNPVLVALVAGVAAALGELSGYLVGFGGRQLVGHHRWQRAVDRWMQRHGFVTITVFAFIPNPAFDAAGIAAGALRYAVWRFALACFIGKTAKFLLVAAFGAQF
jgi:membrane protein YqaA with SNARE-associated domain